MAAGRLASRVIGAVWLASATLAPAARGQRQASQGRQGRPAEDRSEGAASDEEAEEVFDLAGAAHLDVLDSLFPKGDEGELGSQGTGTYEPTHLYYRQEDEITFAVVDSLANALDDGRTSREDVLLAAQSDVRPDFAEVVAGMFDSSDADGDGRLNEAEVDTFKEFLRQLVADALFEVHDDDLDDVLSKIFSILREHPVERQTLVQAAVEDGRTELARLVEDLFDRADMDNDGVLGEEEAERFRDLLDEALFEGGHIPDVEDDDGSWD